MDERDGKSLDKEGMSGRDGNTLDIPDTEGKTLCMPGSGGNSLDMPGNVGRFDWLLGSELPSNLSFKLLNSSSRSKSLLSSRFAAIQLACASVSFSNNLAFISEPNF